MLPITSFFGPVGSILDFITSIYQARLTRYCVC